MTSYVSTKDLAVGRWRSLLPQLGVSAKSLTGKHVPCPICGGRDRFRFDDRNGSGSFFCNRCGSGSGIELVMKLHGVPFRRACQMVEEYLPSSRVEAHAAKRPTGNTDRFVNEWRAGRPLNGSDPASWYLRQRGIVFESFPTQLRFLPKASYWHEDKTKTEHPALGALFVAPDMSSMTVHYTFLDGQGNKAQVPKVKKLAPGRVPAGGAVRLYPSAEVMGIAEGIETALSAAQLFGVPVWASLNAGAMVKWKPPETARKIIIFGDNDANYAGQNAAYGLAYRLSTEGVQSEVRIPPRADTDWNDELELQLSMKEAAE